MSRPVDKEEDASVERWLSTSDDGAGHSHQSKSLHAAGAIFGSFVALTVGLTAPFVVSRSPLPYMATPGRKIRRALKFLDKKRDGLFVDLGSGDGEAVFQAARLGYRSVGIENNFTLWAFSSVRRRLFWTRSERQNSTFLWANFFEYDLRSAGTVMIFGVNPIMGALSRKISAECRPGTDVLSYRFAIPLSSQQQDDDIAHGREKFTKEEPLLDARIVYDDEEMRIYRTTPTACSFRNTTKKLSYQQWKTNDDSQ